MKILVLDGNENQAVACVRSLGRAGHVVSVGAETSWSKAGWSRYSHSSFQYLSPQEDVNGFILSLIGEIKKVEGTLVLPMTERTTLPISANRDLIIAAGGRLILPSHETVLKAFDKKQATLIAESLGVATPKTITISNLQAAQQAASTITYPVILKPYTSEELSPAGKIISTGRPVYARNKIEFIEAYKNIMQRVSTVLVQEYIEGSGIGYFVLMRHGQLRAEFAHKRIRDVHPTGSGSSLRESTLPNYPVRTQSLSILSTLKWHGVAMVEFRIKPDGQPVFLEINGRFWNSLPLAVYSGVDFPRMLAEIADQGDVQSSGGYSLGIRCRWLLGDFRHLLSVIKGPPRGYLGKFPNRLKTLISFFLPSLGTYHDNFMISDPLPELGDWLNFFRKCLRKFKHFKFIKGKTSVKERYSHP